MPRSTLLAAALLALLVLPSEPASARDDTTRGAGRSSVDGDERSPGEGGDGPESPSSDLFGFSDASDIGAIGEAEISLDGSGAFKRRGGRYRALGAFLEVERVLTQNAKASIGASFDRLSTRGVPGLEDRTSGGLAGFSAELRHRLVAPGAASPFGLAIGLESGIGLRDPSGGVRGRGYGLEAKLVLDGTLVPDQVYGTVNLLYGIERFRPRGLAAYDEEGERLSLRDPEAAAFGRAPAERETTLGVSGALAFRVSRGVFLGGEARYLRKYEGFDLRSFEGRALFLGPTFLAELAENATLSGTWSVQVAGRARGAPGRLDLESFEQHQARLKLSIGF